MVQFQITVNITAVIIAFVSAVANPKMESVLTAVQLLWINLIMDTFAALALATDPPTDRILDRKPQPKSAPLITINMWKMIIGQTIFQLAVTFVLYFAGHDIFGFDPSDASQQRSLDTMVFNTFVWMQIFNELNSRRLDNKFNIFEGVHRNKFFLGITILMVGLQVLIVFVGGAAFQISPLNGVQWAICVVTASLCLPWAILIRLFPDEWFAAVAMTVGAPFVVVYRQWVKIHAKVKRIFTRKGSQRPSQNPVLGRETEKTQISAHDTSGLVFTGIPATPQIVLSDGTPRVYGNPIIHVDDIEKGPT
jgi:P-type Ca2+ transporter type 2C